MRYLAAFLLFVTLPIAAQTNAKHGPDCSAGWPTNMAQVMLKNAGLIRNEDIDFTKTITTRIASEESEVDRWHQVYSVTFFRRTGKRVQAIVVHDASSEECSLTDPEGFVVSQHLH
ncbi:MAG: hypothetical protein WBY53_20385 [Acidobacteriaceae bacterium]